MPHAAPSQREPPGVSRATCPGAADQARLHGPTAWTPAHGRVPRVPVVHLIEESGQGSPGPAPLSMIKSRTLASVLQRTRHGRRHFQGTARGEPEFAAVGDDDEAKTRLRNLNAWIVATTPIASKML